MSQTFLWTPTDEKHSTVSSPYIARPWDVPHIKKNESNEVAPDLLIAHSCATEHKWKGTTNNLTNEQMIKDILVKVRQVGYKDHHNRHFLTLKHFQTAGKITIIQMLLYQWDDRIRLSIEQAVKPGGDFEGIAVVERYAGSKGVTHDGKDNIKFELTERVTCIRECSIGLGHKQFGICELATGLFKTEPFQEASPERKIPLQPLKFVGADNYKTTPAKTDA